MSIFERYLIIKYMLLDFIQMSVVRNRCGNREKLLLIKDEKKNKNKRQGELTLSL